MVPHWRKPLDFLSFTGGGDRGRRRRNAEGAGIPRRQMTQKIKGWRHGGPKTPRPLNYIWMSRYLDNLAAHLPRLPDHVFQIDG